jgi:F-type H+-transporting ATPase subunit b
MFNINVGLSAWTIVVFLGLLFVLAKYAWKPILAAVEAREQGIQGALDEAARRNAEAAELLAEHRKQLADARRQATEILAEGKAAGERVRKDIEEKSRAEGQAIIERARQEIERERDAAVDSIRKVAVELALSAASRLMSENLTQAKDRQLVERFLDDMDEGGGAQA